MGSSPASICISERNSSASHPVAGTGTAARRAGSGRVLVRWRAFIGFGCAHRFDAPCRRGSSRRASRSARSSSPGPRSTSWTARAPDSSTSCAEAARRAEPPRTMGRTPQDRRAPAHPHRHGRLPGGRGHADRADRPPRLRRRLGTADLPPPRPGLPDRSALGAARQGVRPRPADDRPGAAAAGRRLRSSATPWTPPPW